VRQWTRYGPLIIELFVVFNLSFLALDIFIAHSFNAFSHAGQWIPFYFSVSAPVLLVFEMGLNRHKNPQPHRWVGFLVGICSSLVGIAGLRKRVERMSDKDIQSQEAQIEHNE